MNEIPEAAVACRIGAVHVARSFGPVRANVDVSLTVRPRTVHALVGENGAGKSTLMRMLYGLDRPDEGSIIVNDEPAAMASPRDAIAMGIGLVQQELAIIPELTLLENLILGDEPRSAGRIDWTAARERAVALAASVGLDIDWSLRAAGVSIAIQQQVEILRLAYRGADVMILDEPTAVLAPAQAADLLVFLGSLRDAGRTIIFISHKLDEVLAIADDVTVLKAGSTVAEQPRAGLDRATLAALIVGASDQADDLPSRGAPGDVRLVVDAVAALDDRRLPRLDGVSFEVRSGEIVGIAAVAGNGQEELAEVLIGVRDARAGRLVLDGEDVTSLSVRARRQAGVAYVSADRKHEGLALALSLTDNAIANADLSGLGRGGWLSRRSVADRVEQVLARARVKFDAASDPASSLSGGNQQRVVIGRETVGTPTVLVASQPTRGVDIRGIGYIHDLLRQSRDEGSAIVLFSEELDELRTLADRIVVICRGRVAGVVAPSATRAEIGALMLGETEEEAA